MNKPAFFAVIVFCLILAPLPVKAIEPYLELHLGPNLLSDSNLTPGFLGIPTEITFDTGFNIGGAVGARLNPNIRVAGEIDYHSNDSDEIEVSGLGTAPITGDGTALSFLVSGYYDFKTNSALFPFVGLGLGFASISVDAPASVITNAVDDSDLVLAYQLTLGLGYKFNQNISGIVAYRYFGTDDPSFADSTGGSFDLEYQSHKLNVGIQYYF